MSREELVKKEFKDYIALLKAFVQGSVFTFEREIDWNSVWHLAEINNTEGILGYLLLINPNTPDSEMTSSMKCQCIHEIQNYFYRAERMEQLIEKMTENGINHLLFKGYLIRGLYPIPELRSFGDIDFVIKNEDRKKCDDLMMEMGFQRGDDWEPVYSYRKELEYYEIHTEVLEVDVSEKADYKEYFSHIWEHVKQIGPHTYEFTPEYHLLYLLTHIAKHIRGAGAGIRMYLDIAFFVQHYREMIDWKYVEEQLKILHFEDFGNIVFTIVEKWFAVKSPIFLRQIPDDTLDEFLAYTLEGGIFGETDRDASEIYLKQNVDAGGHFSRPGVLFHRLFPHASDLEGRYTYLQDKPWLLPFAWVHRLVKTREKLKYHVHEAEGIMTAEDEKVVKLWKLYKEIGL